jgi:hypothetical protein
MGATAKDEKRVKCHSAPRKIRLSPRHIGLYVQVFAMGSNSPVRSIFTLAAPRSPATYSLPLITPAAKPPAGCGKSALSVKCL